jgi:hypothetical protein
MALLVPCVVASIAEHDGVVGRAMAAIAMYADNIGFLLSRTTLTLSGSDSGWCWGECRWRLDDSSSPAGTSVVVGVLHRCRQSSEGLVSKGFFLQLLDWRRSQIGAGVSLGGSGWFHSVEQEVVI